MLSSRPYGEGRPTDSDGFLTLDIQPLSTTEIDAFAERFFRLCYREDATTCRNEVTRFRGALDRSPEAATLAQTALLLTMMLLISRSEQLPDKRHLLYERCLYNFLTALPDRREAAGVLLSDHQFRPDDSEVRQQVTAALAFGTQSAGYQDGKRSTIVLRWDEMAVFLPSGWSRQQRDGFLTWLAGPAGVLTDRADGTLVFAHLSFQEFLTAWHLNATVVSPQEVAEQFAALAQNSTWWETLLLWGAMISGQNAERLNPVIERLLEESYGPSLVGMMAADGTGTDAASEYSTQRFAQQLLRTLPDGWERCLHAWNSSRQDERRRWLCEALTIMSPQAGWLAWLRLDETRARLRGAVDLTLPDNAAAARVIMALRGSRDEQDIAAGRILCGGPPLWPSNPSELSWLQMWPSHRRLASLRLQQAISSGASREEVCAAARWELSPSVPTAQHRQTARALAVYWADDWARDWAEHRVGDLAVYQWAGDLARNWACDLARDLAGYWARNWEIEWPRELPRDWARELARDIARRCHQDSTPDWTPESASDWAREWARGLSFDSARECARQWACQRCDEWALTEIPPWMFDFARVEIVSFGKGAVRWAAASLRTNHILSVACRLSLWPIAERHTNNVAALGQYDQLIDPLWPALGRHVARRSTDEDRALLIDLAQHPEKREPPLRWGLQYIVRGDLLLADGSVLTLDELADEVGLPHLPYLDEMEPEIELD